MLNISDITNKLIKSAKNFYDVSNIDIVFKPSLNLSIGDFYSDFLILLAKKYKKNVNEIFDNITKDFTCENCDISLVGDYVNIRLKSFKLKDITPMNPDVKINHSIVYVPVLNTYSKSLFYRLAFKGLLNSILFKNFNVNSKLYLGNEQYCINFNDYKSFLNILEDVYNKCISDKDVINIINTITKNNNEDLFITLLGPNTYYQRELSKEFFKTIQGQNHFVFKFHSKDWGNVYKEDEHKLCDFIKSIDSYTTFMNLTYMLSKDLDFKEINFEDSRINTQENFIYFLNLTYNRINKFFTKIDNTSSSEFEFLRDDKLRNIILRSYLFKVTLYDSLISGDIGTWIQGVDNLLREVNFVLNSPNFRYKLTNNSKVNTGLLITDSQSNTVSIKDKFVFNFILDLFQDFLK